MSDCLEDHQCLRDPCSSSGQCRLPESGKSRAEGCNPRTEGCNLGTKGCNLCTGGNLLPEGFNLGTESGGRKAEIQVQEMGNRERKVAIWVRIIHGDEMGASLSGQERLHLLPQLEEEVSGREGSVLGLARCAEFLRTEAIEKVDEELGVRVSTCPGSRRATYPDDKGLALVGLARVGCFGSLLNVLSRQLKAFRKSQLCGNG